jgi:hypothetical protein
MVGLATRILVAQRAAEALKVASAPESAIIEANPNWYYFGALGPAVGDFVPFETSKADTPSPYYSIWVLLLSIAVGDGAGTPGIVPVLRTLQEFLDKVSAMVAARDFDGLVALRDSGQLSVVDQASADLGTILSKFADLTLLTKLGDLMGNGSRPGLINESRVVPPSQWTGRDWLHWKHPGRFAAELRKQADASGDDRFRAYAMGWAVSFATLLCGSSFMDSAIGAGYRNQWWRSRWVGNFVDTWAWGYYGAAATMSSDDQPTPAYDAWPSLCAAGLHNMIDLTGGVDAEAAAFQVVVENIDPPLGLPAPPQVLPQEFVSFWLNAWTTAYQPTGDPLFTADRLQRAYLLLWITIWFQTSGAVVGCNPAPSPTPPDACGDNPAPPDWVDPTQTNPLTGLPFVPPSPNAEHDPDIAEIVSGVLLILAGGALCYFGGAAVGVGWITGGIALIVDGEHQLNWDELECQLYWIGVYLYNGLDVLHKLSVFGGVQQPYPGDLASPTLTVEFNGLTLPYTAGAAVCKSRSMEKGDQRGMAMQQPWGGTVSTWTSYPTNPIEEPATDVWRLGALWPSAFIDDSSVNPATEDLTVPPGPFPGGVNGSFGPAVDAAVKLVRNPVQLPDWNLDSDRGRGWLTWQLSTHYVTGSPVPAVPEP